MVYLILVFTFCIDCHVFNVHVVYIASVLHWFLLKDVHVRLNGANYSYDLDEHVEHSYTSYTEQVRYELVISACCLR